MTIFCCSSSSVNGLLDGDAIRKLLFASAKPQQFGRRFEGFGLPLP
jgi:hypothetical protein